MSEKHVCFIVPAANLADTAVSQTICGTIGILHRRDIKCSVINRKFFVGNPSKAGNSRFFKVRGRGSLFLNRVRFILKILSSVAFSLVVVLSLLIKRPNTVYVSTDPPIFVPFLVAIFCKIFRKTMVFHVQDIHPEATLIHQNLPHLLKVLLTNMDNIALKTAQKIITITDSMATTLRARVDADLKIFLLDNAGGTAISIVPFEERKEGFVYSGNLGKFQNIPLLLESIECYRQQGGSWPFVFVGDGVHFSLVSELATRITGVTVVGRVHPSFAFKK